MIDKILEVVLKVALEAMIFITMYIVVNLIFNGICSLCVLLFGENQNNTDPNAAATSVTCENHKNQEAPLHVTARALTPGEAEHHDAQMAIIIGSDGKPENAAG